MGELTLLVLRLAFLVLLWVFVFVIVYALRSDLFGQRVRRMPADGERDLPDRRSIRTGSRPGACRSGDRAASSSPSRHAPRRPGDSSSSPDPARASKSTCRPNS